MGTARCDTTTPYRDEGELLEALRAGSDRAFQHMVRAQGPRLLALARTIVRHEADAEDVLQDALLSAFRGLRSFTGGSRIGTWLHRITVNAALMKLRARRSRDLAASGGGVHRQEDVLSARSQDQPVDRAICRELKDLVRLRIATIAEPHRSILRLRDLEQRSTAETAKILGCTPQAVKTRLHRARRALRTNLEERPAAAVRTA